MIDFAQLQPGFVFAGRYRIESLLSTGGMGAVYVVRHLETDAKLALKVMRPEIVENADARRRFAQEARVASMIESTHVVAVTDAGVDDQLGVPFLVMELLQGRELGDELAARGRIPPAEVVAWLAQVARALDKAHAKGIVHRDLKPENLFMVRTDEEPDKIKILDFGIAKFLQGSGSHTTAASGTPLYMAPEQTAQGNLIGPATDTWALGLIAYTLLVGQPYWQAETIYQLFGEVLSLNREAPSARAVKHGAALPAAFDAWLLKAIAPDPQHRWQRASEAITALGAALAGTAAATIGMADTFHASQGEIPASATTGAPKSERSKGLRIGAIIGIAGLGATIAAGLGFQYWRTPVPIAHPAPSVPPEQDASHATSKLRDTIDASNPMIPRGAIAVQRHEVTREEYAVYLASLGSADRAPATPFDAWTTDADIASLKAPVTWVTQAQSMGFCHAIEARLPTSPEWSDFARPTPSAWASPSTGYAIGQVVSATALPESVQHTGDIIEGVYDLVGNVKEWTDTTKDGLGVVRGEDFGTPSESAATALSQITQKQVGDDPKRARTFSGPRLGFRCVR